MRKVPEPVIGEWYQTADTGDYFEVVAIDDSAGTIEIQYADGAISEFDEDAWAELRLLPASPPEDPFAAFEADTLDDWRSGDNEGSGPTPSIDDLASEDFDDPDEP